MRNIHRTLIVLGLLAAACLPAVPGAGTTATAPSTPVEPTASAVPTEAPVTATAEPTEPAMVDSAGTRWTLVSFGPAGAEAPVVPGAQLTLEFGADGQASGNGGCNNFNSPYQAEGGALSFGLIVSTKRACLEESLNSQEQSYLGALGSAQSFAVNGDQLTITYVGDAGQGVLNFSHGIEAPPTEEATAEASLCATLLPAADPAWLICHSNTYGFEFQLPAGAAVMDSTAGTARIGLPITFGTNLNEKYLDLSVVEGAATCLSPLGAGYAAGTIPTETATLNGLDFTKEQGSDAGAGNRYDWTAYSIAQGDRCVSLGFVLHWHPAELDATPPAEFDVAAESAIFEEIVSTFQWLN